MRTEGFEKGFAEEVSTRRSAVGESLTSNLHSASPMDTTAQKMLSTEDCQKMSQEINNKGCTAYLRDMIKHKRCMALRIIVPLFIHLIVFANDDLNKPSHVSDYLNLNLNNHGTTAVQSIEPGHIVKAEQTS